MKMHMLAAAAVATLALAGCASTSPSYNGGNNSGYNTPPPAQTCYDCGTVTRIDAVGGQQTSGTTGAVLGGVVGAVAGHELAKNSSDGTQNADGDPNHGAGHRRGADDVVVERRYVYE